MMLHSYDLLRFMYSIQAHYSHNNSYNVCHDPYIMTS